MENHPIPQDVTNFEFKLIGNLTVKQFAYLATGTVLTVLLLQLPVNILLKLLFCVPAFLSIGLVYLPIGGRPMDAMIGYYIKALTRPTVFVYDKAGGQAYSPNKTPTTTENRLEQLTIDVGLVPRDKLKDYLKTFDAKAKNKVEEREKNFLMSISGLAASNPPHQSKDSPGLDLQGVDLKIIPQSDPQTNPAGSSATPIPSSEPAIAAQLTKINAPVPARTAPKNSIRPVGTIIAPTFPNLITGTTKDARGNALSSILIEVKDKDGNPIRAFKTNGVGRFASATPLPNGTYTVEFEDPKAQNKFKNIIINAAGQIIQPIEAISIDTREELRRSLFSSSVPTPQETQNN